MTTFDVLLVVQVVVVRVLTLFVERHILVEVEDAFGQSTRGRLLRLVQTHLLERELEVLGQNLAVGVVSSVEDPRGPVPEVQDVVELVRVRADLGRRDFGVRRNEEVVDGTVDRLADAEELGERLPTATEARGADPAFTQKEVVFRGREVPRAQFFLFPEEELAGGNGVDLEAFVAASLRVGHRLDPD